MKNEKHYDGEHGSLAERDALKDEARYVMDLICVLRDHSAGRRRFAVMQSIRKHRKVHQMPIPDNFENAVESAFQHHCAESGISSNGRVSVKAPIFYLPAGKAGGIWGVYRDAAQAWMAGRL